ncbi:MAG: hypothetical protein K2M68_00085 [Muribaculaceae bacterium]|nr:hypothetical protein [Muribaculaceae bacterium]
MKKSLLFSASALMAFGSMFAETWNAQTVFSYNADKDGVCNAMPGIDGGVASLGWWSSGQKTDPNLVCDQSNARFAVGLNGKFYTIDDKQNAIVAIDANGISKYADIPSRVDGKWNGTAINADDAGNIVFNYCFTDATKSVTEWGVVVAGTKQVYNVTMNQASVTALGLGSNRLDCIGKVIGDVRTKAYAFAVLQSSAKLVMFTFTGDGTKPTSLVATEADNIPELAANGGNTSACPSVSFAEFEKAGVIPQNHRFYVPLGVVGNATAVSRSFTDGEIGKWYDVNGQATWSLDVNPMGNRGYAGIAAFELGGKNYIVRNYVDEAMGQIFSNWKQVMTFGIFEAETGKCVATWQDSYFNNGNTGTGSLTAEVVDANTVNIYTYASTSAVPTADEAYKTTPGCYGAMVKFTVEGDEAQTELKGSGTEADPYLIATPEDLCAAHLYIPQAVAGDYVYFKQTADIDMANADYTKWEALNGWGGQYNGKFVYDGDNHLIKNFNPGTTDRDPVDNEGGYYEASIFGVLRGTVKNLGIIDATSVSNGGFDGAGIISDYSGQGGVDAEITNVFVTGKVAGNKRIGGMLAHAGGNNSLTDVYAVVEINAENCPAGGIIGNLNGKSLSIDGGYVSAVITGANSANGLVAGGTAGSVDTYGFVAIGQGDAYASGIDVVENNASKFDSYTTEAKNAIVAIAAFSDGKMLNDMPTFNWVSNQSQGGDDVADIKGSGTLEDPYLIATAADLCEAHNLINQEVAGDYVHFKQTADIDMANADYTKWQALLGWYGAYAGKIKYDGDYHVIRNFKPTDKESIGNAVMEDIEGFGGYYDTSLFGVLRGEVKNLGVINYEGVDQTAGGAAAIAGYSGHSGEAAVVTNVFVTGKVSGNKRNGAIAATMSADNIYTDVYAVIEVNSTNAPAGGLVGTLNNNKLTLDGGYVAATITGTPSTQGLIAGGNGTAEVYNFITIGQGERFATDDVDIDEVESPKFDSFDGTAERCILDMDAFYEGKKLNGMPTFNWMTADQIAAGVDNVVVDNDNQDAPAVYYNLQGVRVENPANGLYIKKQGNKVSKVVIR